MDSSLLKSKSRKFQVLHSKQNVIDLDSDDGYSHQPNMEFSDLGGTKQDHLFYFAKDEEVSKVRYFENDIRNSIQEQILFKDDFSKVHYGDRNAFEPNNQFINANTQTDIEFTVLQQAPKM